MTITTLAAHKGNTWKLELDDSGELYFLHVSVVQRCGLQKGMTLTPQQWIKATDAIGIVSKSGRYGGTYAHTDIAWNLPIGF